MNTDNNQNKQLTELSDEELKNVTGGVVGYFLLGCAISLYAVSKGSRRTLKPASAYSIIVYT